MTSQKTLADFDLENKPQIADPVKTDKKPMTREEKKHQKIFVDTIMYGLRSPFIFPPGGWGDSFPKSILDMANMHRLIQSIQCFDSKMSTMTDAALYLSCQSLVAPLSREWYKVYMHAFSKSMPDKFKILIEDDKWIENDSHLEDNEMESLDRLRAWIFKKQIEQIKSKN